MTSRVARDERGFVLSIVILAVAALSIAGTALFLVVQSERAMADNGAETSNAYHLARAGLARFMGENVGMPPAEQTYTMGGGTVTVRAEIVMAGSPVATRDVYLLTSFAEIRDRRAAAVTARRGVRQFAVLDRQAFDAPGAFAMPSDEIQVGVQASVGGVDRATAMDCEVGGTSVAGVGAVAGAQPIDERNITGNPPVVYEPTAEELRARAGVDWALLTDPATPFDHEFPAAAWPAGLNLLTDVYPSIRVTGDFTATSQRSGRGLLVVDGELVIRDGFSWNGVIIAESIRSVTNSDFTIAGALLVGFDPAAPAARIHFNGRARIEYNSCSVLHAAEGMATFQGMLNTWWETMD